MNKRIKSALITFVSLMAAVITTPAWATFVHWSSDKAVSFGVPIAIIGVITVIIDNVWKQILNNVTLKQMDTAAATGAPGPSSFELY